MSDERYTREPGDDEEANGNGERPFLDIPPPGVRPAKRQPWYQDAPNQHVSGDEILRWVRKVFPG